VQITKTVAGSEMKSRYKYIVVSIIPVTLLPTDDFKQKIGAVYNVSVCYSLYFF